MDRLALCRTVATFCPVIFGISAMEVGFEAGREAALRRPLDQHQSVPMTIMFETAINESPKRMLSVIGPCCKATMVRS